MSTGTKPSSILCPTTRKERKLLRKAGFTHATGLTIWKPRSRGKSGCLGVLCADLSALEMETIAATYAFTSQYVLIFSEGGEIWVGVIPPSGSPREELLKSISVRICPRGETKVVPRLVDTAFEFHSTDLMHRHANPDWLSEEELS